MPKPKSPSRQKRDQSRIRNFNFRKMQELICALEMKIQTLDQELKKKTSTIFKLEVEKSDLKFKMFKSRPKLSIMKTSNQQIPGDQNFTKPKPPKPKLAVSITSNTCDTPGCQHRRRPCHAHTPSNQIFSDWMQ